MRGPDKKKRKMYAPRLSGQNPEELKEKFLKALASGVTPTVAANAVGSCRSVVYRWRREDPKFAEEWVDAIEQGIDQVENSVYKNALKGISVDAHFILKSRRREIYGTGDQQKPAVVVNITLQDQLKRLERLGLPVPMIEGDYEDVTESD